MMTSPRDAAKIPHPTCGAFGSTAASGVTASWARRWRASKSSTTAALPATATNSRSNRRRSGCPANSATVTIPEKIVHRIAKSARNPARPDGRMDSSQAISCAATDVDEKRLRLLRRLVLGFLLQRLPDGLVAHESLLVGRHLARRVEPRVAVGNLGLGLCVAHGSPPSWIPA